MSTVLFVAIFNIISMQMSLVTLEDLKWQNRIIIVMSNDSDMIDTSEQQLKSEMTEITDRDIVYYLIGPMKIRSNSSRRLSLEDIGKLIYVHFQNKDQLRVLLIGKDGGLKMKERKLDLSNIFRVIDSMPMRIREMRKK